MNSTRNSAVATAPTLRVSIDISATPALAFAVTHDEPFSEPTPRRQHCERSTHASCRSIGSVPRRPLAPQQGVARRSHTAQHHRLSTKQPSTAIDVSHLCAEQTTKRSDCPQSAGPQHSRRRLHPLNHRSSRIAVPALSQVHIRRISSPSTQLSSYSSSLPDDSLLLCRVVTQPPVHNASEVLY